MDNPLFGAQMHVNQPIISLKELSFAYTSLKTLQNINYTFGRGTMTAIMGPNGGGKSTLLKLIMGLLKPKSGSITFHHIDSEQIAYLPQLAEMDRHFPLNVKNVVGMGLWKKTGVFKAFTKEDHDNIDLALDQVGLLDYKKRTLSDLSGGQFQRVRFARAILQNADVILLDEPFTAIDTKTSGLLTNLMLEWNATGKTIIAVLHDFEIVRSSFSEALLIARELITHGDPESVLTRDLLLKAHQMIEEPLSITEKLES